MLSSPVHSLLSLLKTSNYKHYFYSTFNDQFLIYLFSDSVVPDVFSFVRLFNLPHISLLVFNSLFT